MAGDVKSFKYLNRILIFIFFFLLPTRFPLSENQNDKLKCLNEETLYYIVYIIYYNITHIT